MPFQVDLPNEQVTWRNVLASIHSLGKPLRQVQDAQLAQRALQHVACTTDSAVNRSRGQRQAVHVIQCLPGPQAGSAASPSRR